MSLLSSEVYEAAQSAEIISVLASYRAELERHTNHAEYVNPMIEAIDMYIKYFQHTEINREVNALYRMIRNGVYVKYTTTSKTPHGIPYEYRGCFTLETLGDWNLMPESYQDAMQWVVRRDTKYTRSKTYNDLMRKNTKLMVRDANTIISQSRELYAVLVSKFNEINASITLPRRTFNSNAILFHYHDLSSVDPPLFEDDIPLEQMIEFKVPDVSMDTAMEIEEAREMARRDAKSMYGLAKLFIDSEHRVAVHYGWTIMRAAADAGSIVAKHRMKQHATE
jgi:hypothetical protein